MLRSVVFLLSLSFLLLSACGGGSKDAPCQGADCQCTPMTCDDLGAQCGAADDGCGGTLSCGGCPDGQLCGEVMANVCDPNCGNGVLDPDEQCDDGNRATESCEYGEDYYCEVCNAFCNQGPGHLQYCGDAEAQDDFEECDDGNDVDWDGCDTACVQNPCELTETFHLDRTNLRGLDRAGDRLYVTDSTQITVFDISTPSQPVELGSFGDGNLYLYDVIAADGFLYVAVHPAVLQVWSLADPDAPALTATLEGDSDNEDMATSLRRVGDRLYVAAGSEGLHIVDISTPGSPVLLGTHVTDRRAMSVEALGSTAYVGTSQGIEVVDVSNPGATLHLTTYDPVDNISTTDVLGLRLEGDRLYVSGHTIEVRILDVSAPQAPVEIAHFEDRVGGFGGDIDVREDGVPVFADSSGIFTLDVDAPAASVLGGGVEAEDAKRLLLYGDVAYVTANNLTWGNRYLKAVRITCD